MRYVVVVKPPDDHPGAVRVFGTFLERELATSFRDKVRGQVDLNTLDETSGYAYVMRVERPRLKEAYAWATRGEEI